MVTMPIACPVYNGFVVIFYTPNSGFFLPVSTAQFWQMRKFVVSVDRAKKAGSIAILPRSIRRPRVLPPPESVSSSSERTQAESISCGQPLD